MSNVTALDENNFDNLVLKTDKPVLVDFYADWCGPCKLLAPTIDKLAAEVQSQAYVYKLNVDENVRIANQFEVTSIPTLIVFKNGDIVARHTGTQNINQIKQMLGL